MEFPEFPTSLGPKVVVKDSGGVTQTGDLHRNPDKAPKFSKINPNLAVEFDKDDPNGMYNPTDAVIKIKVTPTAHLPAQTLLCSISFGGEYVDKKGNPLPPIVLTMDESSLGLTPAWRLQSVTSTGFQVFTGADLNATGQTLRVRFLVTPSQ